MTDEEIKQELPERLRRFPVPKIVKDFSDVDRVILAYNSAVQYERTELHQRLKQNIGGS